MSTLADEQIRLEYGNNKLKYYTNEWNGRGPVVIKRIALLFTQKPVSLGYGDVKNLETCLNPLESRFQFYCVRVYCILSKSSPLTCTTDTCKYWVQNAYTCKVNNNTSTIRTHKTWFDTKVRTWTGSLSANRNISFRVSNYKLFPFILCENAHHS